MNGTLVKIGLVSAALSISASAAYAQTPQPQSTNVELARVEGGEPIRLNIKTSCKGPDPVFEVLNVAGDWPRLTELQVVRLRDGRIVVKQRMRMKTAQKASFRMPTERLGEGEYGIRFLPSWYERQVEMDARISCQ